MDFTTITNYFFMMSMVKKLLSALKSWNVEFGNQWMGLCHTEHLTLDIVDIYFLSALLHGVLD